MRAAAVCLLHAPCRVPGCSNASHVPAWGLQRGAPRRWHFTSPQPGQRPGTRHPVKITGWDDAKATIRGALQQHGPVFGLMGFSQGATAAAMYASCCAADAALPAPRCVLCVAGFMPRDDECAAWLRRDGVAMPALHVVGEADEIISRERSEELAKVCAAGRTHVHAGGHLVPSCTGEVKQCLTQFFDGVPAEGGGVGRASQAVSAL